MLPKHDEGASVRLAAAYGHADIELIIATLTEGAHSVLVPEADRKRLLQIVADMQRANSRRHHFLRHLDNRSITGATP